MFHTLKYAKILEEVGFSRAQAETSVKVLVEIMEDKLASKQDLKDLQLATQQEFAAVRGEMKQEFAAVRSEAETFRVEMRHEFTAVRSEAEAFRVEVRHEFALVRAEIRELGSNMTIRLGGIVIAAAAVTTAIQKLF